MRAFTESEILPLNKLHVVHSCNYIIPKLFNFMGNISHCMLYIVYKYLIYFMSNQTTSCFITLEEEFLLPWSQNHFDNLDCQNKYTIVALLTRILLYLVKEPLFFLRHYWNKKQVYYNEQIEISFYYLWYYQLPSTYISINFSAFSHWHWL